MDPANPVFYRLPARLLQVGMSTDDGKDILTLLPGDEWIIASVYTPRPDDLEQDEANRDESESRMYRPDEPVDLAAFSDTSVDGSGLPEAELVEHPRDLAA